MRLRIIAVGRLKAGPERELYDRYAERIAAAGKGVGITYSQTELAESRAGSAAARIAAESTALAAAIADVSAVIVLDATGKAITSPAFAERIARWRDTGARDLALVVGGPDGLAASLRDRADLVLAFGAMTWPHQLVRIMLTEQLYRAVTILSGHPYHRG